MDRETTCPEIEVLERYAAGRLQKPEAEAFEKHLAVCGICSVVIERLGDFDQVAAAVTAGGPEPDWTAMEGRLGVRSGTGGKVKGGGWGGSWFRSPALGYAMALALAYPAWLGVSRRGDSPAAQDGPAGRGASVVDLNATRSETGLPVVGAGAGGRVVLQFLAPAEPGTRQRAEIRDGGGKVMDLGEVKSFDGRGNFALVVDPEKLAAGRCVLVVRGGGESVFEFERQ